MRHKAVRMDHQWNSNSLMKVCLFSLLTIIPTEASAFWTFDLIYKAFCLDVAQGHMNGGPNEIRLTREGLTRLAC